MSMQPAVDEQAAPEADSTSKSDATSIPEFGDAKHLAYHSCDASGVVRYDLSCLRSFRQPRVPADLSEGRAECVNRNRKNRTLGHRIPLDDILGACLALGSASAVRQAHVVTWRGIITKIMTSKDPLHVYMSFIDGVLYLMEVDPYPRAVHISQIESGYHGYAFEALCTSEDPDAVVHVEMDIWKCIVSRTLGDLNLVYGGEVDCVRGQYTGDSSNFLELKTKRALRYNRNVHKWFVQSHLMGVPHIFVGTRDERNVLESTRLVPTDEYAPGRPTWLTTAQANAHSALHALRNACASHVARNAASMPGDDTIWRATLRHGEIQTFHVVDKKEASQWRAHAPRCRRVGLLPADHIAQLRVSAAWAKTLGGRE